jgi:hypothetical protein
MRHRKRWRVGRLRSQASPFTQKAVYDGAADGYPAVRPGSEGRMLWHQLTREG